MLRSPIKHCRNCGAAVVYRVPDDGDTHERAVCPACDTIHYENPLNVVGTVPVLGRAGAAVQAQHRAALGQVDAAGRLHGTGRNHRRRAPRARPTRKPARSSKWKTCSRVLSVPRVGQVHLFYRARLLSDRFDPGHETIEARLFSEERNPLGRNRVQDREGNAAALLRRPAQGPLRRPHHRHRLNRGCAGPARPSADGA